MAEADGKIVLLAGASGLTGARTLDALLDAPDFARVLAVSRRPLGREHSRLANRIVPFEQIETQLKGVSCEAALCCLGTTHPPGRLAAGFPGGRPRCRAHLRAHGARAAGVKRFVVISAAGANPASKNFYLRTKGEMEEQLEALGFESLDILQPSMLLGWRAEMRPLELLADGLHAAASTRCSRASTPPIAASRRAPSARRCWGHALGPARRAALHPRGHRGARAPDARARPRAAASQGARARALASTVHAPARAPRACAPRSCSASAAAAEVRCTRCIRSGAPPAPRSARRERRRRRLKLRRAPRSPALAAALIGTLVSTSAARIAGGFDCSGLALYVHARVGISIPRTAAAQQRAAQAVPLTQLLPGDLVFFPHASARHRSRRHLLSAPAASCTRRIAGVAVASADSERRVFARSSGQRRALLGRGGVVTLKHKATQCARVAHMSQHLRGSAHFSP